MKPESAPEEKSSITAVKEAASRKRFWNPNKWLSISAFLISLATFLVLIYQTHLASEQAALDRQQALLEQKQQYASVLPYLELGDQTANDKSFRLILTNNGLGPAFLRQVLIHYQGKVYQLNPAQFLYQHINPNGRVNFYYTGINPGRLIPAGQQLVLVGIEGSEADARRLQELFGSKASARLELVYASIYEETFRVRMGEAPVKLREAALPQD